ncbi:MAG: prephenate dehydrogenase/arogenate dehydrogenase family protein [Deferribacteres bacterium]|nr:prephenate dehydrogenase/arogenate dehydrogenase family protein [candidate division KSB1 bacterium]MCB9501818.1 prephenate dehydrogenase/arogenate dehydrogenase family protein [Deferribacteres bacterium]
MTPKITIIGIGLIGGSLARAFKRFLPDAHVTGVDRAEIIDYAQKESIIDIGYESEVLVDACADADFVLIATPPHSAMELLPAVANACKIGAIVSDVCSIKADLVKSAKRAFENSSAVFIGGHPMAGSEKPGVASSDPYLFENAIYVLTPDGTTPEEAVGKLAHLVGKIRAHVLLLEAEEHDKIAASVSHLPQMLAITLMLYVAGKNEENAMYLKMAAGGFRDMTRIASSPYDIWRDICAGNRKKILAEIDGFANALATLREKVAEGNLQESFENSARSRLAIPTDTRGFMHPHFDLSVDVQDKSGVIATIANVLAKAEINIRDIEVLKVREDEGGTLRLSFESDHARSQAKDILQKQGYVCRNR